MTIIRLQVALARAGIASRRKSEEIIVAGRVKVNGKVIHERGFHIDASRDKILFDEKSILFEKKGYYILNKPEGILTTLKDEKNRRTVLDFIKNKEKRFYPVGRLDKNTTGLLILTNDGELTFRLTHPKYRIKRLYEVKVKGVLNDKDISCLKKGVVIDKRRARPDEILIKKISGKETSLRVTLREGRKREIRRLFESIGKTVLGLKRIAYGPLRLGGLKEGEVRPLKEDEIKKLRKCVGL